MALFSTHDGKREYYYYNTYKNKEDAKKIGYWHRRKGRFFKIKYNGSCFDLYISDYISLSGGAKW